MLDGYVDFDKATHDPQHPLQYLPQYDSGDHVHPSDAGYQVMANAIDLSLFTKAADIAGRRTLKTISARVFWTRGKILPARSLQQQDSIHIDNFEEHNEILFIFFESRGACSQRLAQSGCRFRSVGDGKLACWLFPLLCCGAPAAHSPWVATWGAAMVATDPGNAPDFTGQTLREIVHTSVGGQQARVWLSNRFGTEPLHIGAAHIALSASGSFGTNPDGTPNQSGIQAGTDHALTFNGIDTVVIPPGCGSRQRSSRAECSCADRHCRQHVFS